MTMQEDEASPEIEDVHPIPLEELPEKSDAVTEEVFIKKMDGKKSIRNGKKEKKIEERPVILENSGEEEKKTVDEDDVKPKGLTGASLGNADFKKDYNLKYAYLVGGMYRGIASKEMVVRVGKAGMMGFLGTDGMSIDEIEHSIIYIQKELNDGQTYGMNLMSNSNRPQHEERIVDLFLKHRIRNVEAATSDAVKDLLQQANVQDTEYAPSMEMFEFGAKMQVLKRSLFFPARANKLYELYRHYDSIEEIDRKAKTQIQEIYFRKSFDQVYEECKKYQSSQEIERAGRNPKYKMAMIFKWYFRYASELALNGNPGQKVDYMIYCGPAMGAFNQWVKGTRFEDWRNRHVDEIGIRIVEEAAKLLSQRLDSMAK